MPKIARLGVVVSTIVVAILIFTTKRNSPIPEARQILLKSRRIELPVERTVDAFAQHQKLTSRGTMPFMVASKAPVTAALRSRIAAHGAVVRGFLPKRALVVEADRSAWRKLCKDEEFQAVLEYLPQDKISPQLRAAMERETKAGLQKPIEITLETLDAEYLQQVIAMVEAEGGEVIEGVASNGRTQAIQINADKIMALAERGEVKWLERYTRPTLHNDVAVLPGQMNVTPVQVPPLSLTGNGVNISTSDSGIDTGNLSTLHADLTNAVVGMQLAQESSFMVEMSSTDISGHGTHTAGSLVGDGTHSEGKIRGVAPGAKLWAWFCYGKRRFSEKYGIYLPSTYEKLFNPSSTKYPATIHSASWGGGDYGVYDTQCAGFDEYCWNHPEFLPVVSAGNSGVVEEDDGSYSKLVANTVSSPAVAKNVLAVGATQTYRPSKGCYWEYCNNSSRLVAFSSCGPCIDGRIKPDIVAPGTYILSTLSTQCGTKNPGWEEYNDYYCYMGGTSMSCPLTAGSAALVTEWLRNFRGITSPSAALVKAVITGGASDLSQAKNNNALHAVPDTRQGWGKVNLAGAITEDGTNAVYVSDRLPFVHGSNIVFTITTTNVAPLSAQLCWVDYPAEAEAAACLVNDLDLEVSAITGEVMAVWYGNGGSSRDCVNNNESVRIDAAPPSTYVVRVKGTNIPYDYLEGGAAALYLKGAFATNAVKVALRPYDEPPECLVKIVSYGQYDYANQYFQYYSVYNTTVVSVESNSVFRISLSELPFAERFAAEDVYGSQCDFRLGDIGVEWAGDEESSVFDDLGRTPTNIELVVDSALTISCYYYDANYLFIDSTNSLMPYWWYWRYLYKWDSDNNYVTLNELFYSDADGDGAHNWREYLRGTDPADPLSRPIDLPTSLMLK